MVELIREAVMKSLKETIEEEGVSGSQELKDYCESVEQC